MILLVIAHALAAEPCPVVAEGEPVPAGVVVAGRLACDGVLASTSDLASVRAELELVRAQVAEGQAELLRTQAALARAEGETQAAQAERDGEHIARVAAEAAIQALAEQRQPVPAWVAVAGGTALGLGACWLAPGAPQWGGP